MRVEPDDDGWGTEITKVVLVVEPEDIPLARDDTGHFLVYDEDFDRIQNLATDIRLDGIRGAVSVAEDKHRWPGEHLLSTDTGWELGPDPRLHPHYYDDDPAEDAAEEVDEDWSDATPPSDPRT